MGQGHVIFSLVCCVADHETLVAGPDVLLLPVDVDAFCDLAGLLVQGHYNGAGAVVHADIDWVVADLLDGLPDNLLDIGFRFGADLSENHADGIFDSSLACYHGVGVFGETGVKDWVGDVVAEFIGVSASDTLGGEEEVPFFGSEMLFLHNRYLYCWLEILLFYLGPISKLY